MLKQFTVSQGDELLPDVNIYWDNENKILFDCGPDRLQSFLVFLRMFRNAGNELDDIKYIVLTHHHIDHIGGLKFFPESIPVIYNENILNFQGIQWNTIKNNERLIDRFIIKDEYKVQILNRMLMEYDDSYSVKKRRGFPIKASTETSSFGEWTFIPVEGHSSSDLICYRRKNAEIVSGDIILHNVFFNNIIEMDKTQNKLVSFRKMSIGEMKKLVDLQRIEIFIGHGKPFELDGLKINIKNTIRRRKRTEKKVNNIFETDRLKPVAQTAEEIFKTFISYDYFLPFSEVLNIYLDNNYDSFDD